MDSKDFQRQIRDPLYSEPSDSQTFDMASPNLKVSLLWGSNPSPTLSDGTVALTGCSNHATMLNLRECIETMMGAETGEIQDGGEVSKACRKSRETSAENRMMLTDMPWDHFTCFVVDPLISSFKRDRLAAALSSGKLLPNTVRG